MTSTSPGASKGTTWKFDSSCYPKVQTNNIKARHRIFNANVPTSLKSAPLHPPTCLSKSTPRAFILLPGQNIIATQKLSKNEMFCIFHNGFRPGSVWVPRRFKSSIYMFLNNRKKQTYSKTQLVVSQKFFNHNKLPALRELVNGYTKQ